MNARKGRRGRKKKKEKRKLKERRRITIVVGEETRLSFSCLVEFATCVYIVQSKWDVAGMLSKNLHMTGTRCSETKECSMSYEHEGVQGLRSRKQAALSLPEYISVTAYRIREETLARRFVNL